MSRKTLQTLTAVIVSAGLTAAACFGYYFVGVKPSTDNTKTQLKSLQEIMASNLHSVYVASHDLATGEVLTPEDAYIDSRYISDVDWVISSDDFGKVLLSDVSAGSMIPSMALAQMETPAENEWLVEYSCFRVSPIMTPGAYIDVRLRFQNGEDYVVLSKKQIKDMKDGACYLTVTSEEMQMMASAIVDAGVYSASLYSTLYTSPSIQEPTFVDYIPSFENKALFPTVYAEWKERNREEMEKRLDGESNNTHFSNTSSDVKGNNVDNDNETYGKVN